MKSIVGSALRFYRFSLVPGQTIAYSMSLTLSMTHGLTVSVQPRQRSAALQ